MVAAGDNKARQLWATVEKIADGELWQVPATIDDAVILEEIGSGLKGHGVGS